MLSVYFERGSTESCAWVLHDSAVVRGQIQKVTRAVCMRTPFLVQAARAYDRVAAELIGPTALTNFPLWFGDREEEPDDEAADEADAVEAEEEGSGDGDSKKGQEESEREVAEPEIEAEKEKQGAAMENGEQEAENEMATDIGPDCERECIASLEQT